MVRSVECEVAYAAFEQSDSYGYHETNGDRYLYVKDPLYRDGVHSYEHVVKNYLLDGTWEYSTGGAVAGEVPLSYGLLLDAAREAYGQVIEHPELKDETMEIRRLRIGGLRIEAFWLKAAPFDDELGENDRLYTFLAYHPELKNKLVTRDAFLAIVRGLAAKSARIDNKPRLSRR